MGLIFFFLLLSNLKQTVLLLFLCTFVKCSIWSSLVSLFLSQCKIVIRVFWLLNRKRKPVTELFFLRIVWIRINWLNLSTFWQVKKKKKKVKNTSSFSFPYSKRPERLVCLGSRDPGYRYLLCSWVYWTRSCTLIFSHPILELFLQISLNVF